MPSDWEETCIEGNRSIGNSQCSWIFFPKPQHFVFLEQLVQDDELSITTRSCPESQEWKNPARQQWELERVRQSFFLTDRNNKIDQAKWVHELDHYDINILMIISGIFHLHFFIVDL